MMANTFTWTENTDPEIYANGVDIVVLCETRSAVLQKFIEEVSNTIGIKLDFRQTSGLYFVMTRKKDYQAACEALKTHAVDWTQVAKVVA